MQVKTKGLPKTPINQTLNPQNQQVFPIGSQVEVSSDEEGFRGAWYVATVLKSPPARHSHSLSSSKHHSHKIFVEYKTLFSDETGTALLREFVDVNLVRPEPSVDDKDVNFEPNDVVDAYYQDGWWSGVVTEVVEPKSKYKVFFSNPPDEIVFGLSDLRVHRTWVHGIWVLPQKQRMRDLSFSPGTAVEVNIDADNSLDVWFPAKVVKQVSKSNFLVEYQSSAEAGLQKVGVDSLHIRPPPPSPSDKTFSLLEKVDAYCDCRWLSGIITKILADGRFIVYFKHIKKEKELYHSELRLHMEWTNGKWVHCSQDTSMPSKSEKQPVHPNGGDKDKLCAFSEDSVVMKENNGQLKISTATLRHCEKESQTTGSEYISITQSNKRNKQTNVNGDAISLRRSRRSNEEAVSDAMLYPEVCKPNAKQTEVLSSVTSVDIETPTPDHQGKSSLQQSEDSNQPSDPADIKDVHKKLAVTPKRGRLAKLRAIVAETVAETSTRSELVKPFEPVATGLTHNDKLIESIAESSRPLWNKKTIDEGKQSIASADRESVGEPQKEGEVTNLKRKRGRSSKVVLRLGSLKITEAGPESVGNKSQDVNVEGSPKRLAQMDKVENPVAAVEPLQICSANPSDPPTEGVRIISDCFKRVGLNSSKRSYARRQNGKHRKIPVAAAMEPANKTILRDGGDNSREEATEDPESGVGVVNTVVDITTSNSFDDDKPLSAWLEGAHSPPATDGNTSRDNDSAKRQDETPLIQSNAIVAREDEKLPFVKNSVIWKMIESMEVLKRIPQKPHFQPLYQCKEECREGLAIGSMVTFTSLAERISGARFDDPKSVLDGFVEALVDLEELGFNVGPLREVLHKLLSIKSRYEQAQNTSKEIERLIRERKQEKSKIDEKIAELEKKITELKEKQGVALSKKERIDSEISLLQASVDAVGSAKEEFDEVTASFW